MSVWNINYLGWDCFQKIAEYAQASERQTLALCNKQASRVVRKVWGKPNFKKGQMFKPLGLRNVFGFQWAGELFKISKIRKYVLTCEIKPVDYQYSRTVEEFTLFWGAKKRAKTRSRSRTVNIVKTQTGWGLEEWHCIFGQLKDDDFFIRGYFNPRWDYGQMYVKKIMLTKAVQDAKEPNLSLAETNTSVQVLELRN